jgi:hypothetical protein
VAKRSPVALFNFHREVAKLAKETNAENKGILRALAALRFKAPVISLPCPVVGPGPEIAAYPLVRSAQALEAAFKLRINVSSQPSTSVVR